MCQYDTDAPAQGHPHPHAGILQKIKLKLELVYVKHYAPNCLTLTLLDSNTACPWW